MLGWKRTTENNFWLTGNSQPGEVRLHFKYTKTSATVSTSKQIECAKKKRSIQKSVWMCHLLTTVFCFHSWQPVKGSNETLKEVRFDSSDQLVGPADDLSDQLVELFWQASSLPYYFSVDVHIGKGSEEGNRAILLGWPWFDWKMLFHFATLVILVNGIELKSCSECNRVFSLSVLGPGGRWRGLHHWEALGFRTSQERATGGKPTRCC